MVHRPASEPLSWIAPEVERVLAGARLACERASAHNDPAALRQARAALHETRGVLIVAGLEGFADYVDLLGRALQIVAKRPRPEKSERRDVRERLKADIFDPTFPSTNPADFAEQTLPV